MMVLALALRLTLQVPEQPCKTGAPCWLVYTIVNAGAEPARLHDPDPARDHPPQLVLNGKPVPIGHAVPAEVRTLQPGERVEYAVQLDPLAPGKYNIHAVLDPLGLNLRSEPIRFRVVRGPAKPPPKPRPEADRDPPGKLSR